MTDKQRKLSDLVDEIVDIFEVHCGADPVTPAVCELIKNAIEEAGLVFRNESAAVAGAMTEERLAEIAERAERRFGAFIRADALELIAALRASRERERELRVKAALFDFLAEVCSYSYGGSSASEPSPAEFGIAWQWEQSSPEKPRMLDELTRQAAEYYQRYINEMDPGDTPTDWDRQVIEHLAALTLKDPDHG